MRRRLAKVAAAALAVGALAACSPTDIAFHNRITQGTTTTIIYRAKAGPDDGAGHSFRAAAVCAGEPFWRRGAWVSVDGTPDPSGYFYARVQCFDSRQPFSTWERV